VHIVPLLKGDCKMTNYTYVDSALVLDQVEAPAALELENGFSVSADDAELLTLTFNNKAVMFAAVYLLDNGSYETQVAEVLNDDLDTNNVDYNVDYNVATVEEAGAVVRKAFEALQYKLMQDNF
jgi:hypothetical protein